MIKSNEFCEKFNVRETINCTHCINCIQMAKTNEDHDGYYIYYVCEKGYGNMFDVDALETVCDLYEEDNNE